MRLMASAEVVHGLCAALVVSDAVLRSIRVRMMMRAFGARIGIWEALALTTFGDAAAAITPWRIGGDVARVMGARASGARVASVVSALAIETAITYGLAAVVGVWLGSHYGSAWLGRGRTTATPVSATLVMVIAGAAIVGASIVVMTPSLRARCRELGSAALRLVRAAQGLSPSVIGWCAVLSGLSLAARVAVLPLLATNVNGLPAGAMTLVSFTLLHAQIAIPTPAGAGVIELAFLGGAIGFTAGVGRVLAWWRVYMTAMPIATGLTLGAVAYGRPALQMITAIFSRPDHSAALPK